MKCSKLKRLDLADTHPILQHGWCKVYTLTMLDYERLLYQFGAFWELGRACITPLDILERYTPIARGQAWVP